MVGIQKPLYTIPLNSNVTHLEGRNVIHCVHVILIIVSCFIFQGMVLRLNEVKGLLKVIKPGLVHKPGRCQSPHGRGLWHRGQLPLPQLTDGKPPTGHDSIAPLSFVKEAVLMKAETHQQCP